MHQDLVAHPERATEQVDDACGDKSISELAAQESPTRRLEKFLVDLTIVVEDQVNNAVIEPPLKRAGEDLPVTQHWNRQRQVQYVLVDESNEIVVFAHEAAGDVDSVQSLFGVGTKPFALPGRQIQCRVRVGITEGHDSSHDVLPGDCLHVLLRDLQQMDVEVSHYDQAARVDGKLNCLPDEIEDEKP